MTHRFVLPGLLAILFLCLVGAFLLVPLAWAGTTINVNTTADELIVNGNCSLREAIIAANTDSGSADCPAGSGADTIVLPSGTYTLTLGPAGDEAAASGDLDITDNLTLTGAGTDSTLVNGNALDRVFHVLTSTVQFSGITIEGGSATNYGGGLFNEGGNVTLTNSAVVNNTVNPPSGGIGGGGVYNTATGTMTVSASAVLSNTTTGTNIHGGGVYNVGILTLVNTTLSGNQATRSGGGLYNTGTATLSNVTITNNTADSNADDRGDAGGIRTTGAGATVAIRNSILAGNLDNSAGLNPTINPDCNGTLTSQEYNLLGIDKGCTFTALTGDQVGTASSPIDPRLGPLQINGGPTPTHAFLLGSPAIDAGDNTTCATTDQRGSVRPMDGDGNGTAICDIGAYELRMLVVNSTADKTDANPADGICQTLTPGECTLRAAIQQANAASGPDIIVVPSGVYQLALAGAPDDNAATGDLDILDDVTISGSGSASTIVDGGALDRVFHVVNPTVTASISGVTIRNGHAVGALDPFGGSGGGLFNNGDLLLTNSTVLSSTADFGGGGVANNGALAVSSSVVMSNTAPLTTTPASGAGGGVANNGRLSVVDSLIRGNTASNDGGGLVNAGALTATATTIRGNTSGDDGGGLRNFGLLTIVNSTVISNSAVHYGGGLDNGSFNNSLTGTLTVTGSTFTGNTSNKDGGGLYNELGTLALTNGTVSGNAAAGNGGGLYNYNAPSTSNVNNVTLANNTADSDANDTGSGGGIFNNTGAVNLMNTIVAGNADNSPTTQDPDCSGTLNSQDYNLIQDISSGCIIGGTTTNNKTGSPSLGPLQDNGGPTLTLPLLTGSPAIDAANNATCAPTDQRNGARPVDGDGDGSATCDIGAYEVGAKVYWLYLPLVARNP